MSALTRAFANEIFDMIADALVPLPVSLTRPHHPHTPLVFPDNPPVELESNFLALALADSTMFRYVTARSWKHVVLTRRSHVSNILERPFSPDDSPVYRTTVRLDILIPPPITPDFAIGGLLSSFSQVTTLIWKHPPTAFFHQSNTLRLPSITHLQIAHLPPRFGMTHLKILGAAFNRLVVLQISHCDAMLTNDTNSPWPTPQQPIFPDLARLAVGVRSSFVPPFAGVVNNFLHLCSLLPTNSVCPRLLHLSVEIHVSGAQTFVQQQGRSITTLGCSSSNGIVLLNPLLLSAPQSLSTLVLEVDSYVQDVRWLPPQVHNVVLVQAVVPAWIDIPMRLFHVVECLTMIHGLKDHAVRRVACENRALISSAEELEQTERFEVLGIDFSLFDFGKHFSRSSCSRVTERPLQIPTYYTNLKSHCEVSAADSDA